MVQRSVQDPFNYTARILKDPFNLDFTGLLLDFYWICNILIFSEYPLINCTPLNRRFSNTLEEIQKKKKKKKSHMVPMQAAILENFHCEQPCYGFLGLLKFLCFTTLPNLVNCFLIIFSLVWHPKDFAQIKITHGKNASNPSNRSAIVKSFSLCLTSHH